MTQEAAPRSLVVADLDGAEAAALYGGIDDSAVCDSIPARDLVALKGGIVDEFAAKISNALSKSYLLRQMIKAVSGRFARHVENKDHLNITDPAVGTILQEIFLRVRASLSGEIVAHSSEDYLTLEEPLRSIVSATADRAVNFLGTIFLISLTENQASALSTEFCQVLEENDLLATESLVGAVLQEVWLRVHRQLQA